MGVSSHKTGQGKIEKVPTEWKRRKSELCLISGHMLGHIRPHPHVHPLARKKISISAQYYLKGLEQRFLPGAHTSPHPWAEFQWILKLVEEKNAFPPQ